jgi:hypothetical protein
MPILPSGAADRIQKLRQKIVAASDLPKGAAASDVTDATEGRVWRTVDGCCESQAGPDIFIRFGGIGNFGLPACTNLVFNPAPVPVGTVITVENTGPFIVTWFLGSGDPSTQGDPPYNLVHSEKVLAGQTASYTVQLGDVILSTFYKEPFAFCPFVPPGGGPMPSG